MPASDYSSAVSGGLKLKGGAKDAGVKKKSKKSKTPKPAAERSDKSDTKPSEDSALALSNPQSDKHAASKEEAATTPSSELLASSSTGAGKTDAQRRHEEIKRKRLDDRLRREGGAKTHKQRVEDLNKYLSTLSEHHDMPRIGPG